MSNEKQFIIPAGNFLNTVASNVENKNLSDADFRDLVRVTLPIVNYPDREENIKKYNWK